MADGAPDRTFLVTLGEPLASRLEQTARDAGFDTETFLADMIATTLVNRDAIDGRTDAAKAFQRRQAEIALAEYDRTGVSSSLEDVLAEFRDEVETDLAAKAAR